MEKILRSKEMAEIVLLPVRHHSPACSFHVRKVIEAYRPSVVLIEGPENANGRVRSIHAVLRGDVEMAKIERKYMAHYLDAARPGNASGPAYVRIGKDLEEYSPELSALKAADELELSASFMDLSYGNILAASKEGAGLRKKEEKNTKSNLCCPYTHWSMVKLPVASPLKKTESFPTHILDRSHQLWRATLQHPYHNF